MKGEIFVKHLAKTNKLISSRFVPMLLVVMLVASMVTMAFSATTVASSLSSDEVADYKNVAVGTGNDESKAYWVDATYYDYLTDAEMGSSGWLNPEKSGTGYNGSKDDWYPYDNLNAFISNNSGSNNYPLYFGNFCNTWDAYPYNGDNQTTHGGPYREVTKNLKNFNYFVNNSNGLDSYNTSVGGLVNSSLVNGSIASKDGSAMPQFNNQLLKDNNMAKIITSSFPFRETKVGDVTTYSFDSTGGNDNVFFNWSGTTPTSVGYGQGSDYAVEDGLKYFMKETTLAPGIFPFNNTAKTSNGRSGNENLDYGFGVKLNIDFKLPENGLLPTGEPVKFTYTGDDDLWVYISDADGSNSELVLDLGGDHKKASGEINFNTMKATADKTIDAGATVEKAAFIYDSMGWGDEMRVWAWDDGGLGGQWYYPQKINHDGTTLYYVTENQQGSSGTPFKNMTKFKTCKGDWAQSSTQDTEASVSGRLNRITYNDNPAYDKGGDMTLAPQSEKKETTFHNGQNYQRNTIYHMTIFYMERGMLESNCKMAFTMTPAENLLTVTNTVNVDGVNPALQQTVRENEKFDYLTTAKDSAKQLKDTINHGGKADYNNEYSTGEKLKIKQTEDSVLKFNTTYDVIDRMNDNQKVNSGEFASDARDKTIDEFDLVNRKNELDTASMQVDFYNTPVVADLVIDKAQLDHQGQPESEAKTFGYKLLVDLKGGENYKPYNLSYYYKPAEGTTAASAEKMTMNQGEFTFPSDKTVVVYGLPVNATYKLSEVSYTGYVPTKAEFTGTIAENSNTVNFENKLEPTTAPPTTAPPTTEPPTTVPPTTEPPTTAPPTTAPPTTEPPTTAPPTTEPPTTAPPTTEPPTTEPPTTEPPTTEPPTTEPPTTQPPTTEPPTTVPPTEPETYLDAPNPEINKIISDGTHGDYITTANIGDTVTFVLTANIPGTEHHKISAYAINDTYSEGLTYDAVTSVVLVNGDDTRELTEDEYTVNEDDGSFAVELSSELLEDDEFYTYTNVVVYFDAVLNENAVIGGEGNPNEDSLTYTNENGEEIDVEGNEVRVYTFEIDVNKVDSKTGKALSGVEFAIYASKADAEAGKNALMTLKTDKDGLAQFIGLDEGTYYIKELKALEGYALNTTIFEVEVAPEFDEEMSLTNTEDGVFSIEVENTPNEMPVTGYERTIFFTAMGVFLISAAGLIFLLALRKRERTAR